MIGVDDGIWNGNFNLADVAFLLAAILFLIAGVLALARRPEPTGGALLPLGLCLVAFGLLVI